jgi:hypothetical protein
MQPRALLLLLMPFAAVCPLFAQSTGKVQKPLIPDRRPVPDGPGTPTESAPSRKDIPTIAKAANGTIVSIIMSDKDDKPIAQGSGFLVSKDGLVITNYHVIAEGSSAVVKLPDGAFYVVDGVLASDKIRDVAVIKAHGSNFRTLTLGNSDGVQVGEEVVAIGNPLSLESTVSNGIISGIRTADKLGGKFLQITTPISPGSSGGPLFNMAGEVVGITSMYLEGGENLNFAIPVNDAKRLLLGHPSKVQNFPNETESAEKPISEQNDASSEQQRLCYQQARTEADEIAKSDAEYAKKNNKNEITLVESYGARWLNGVHYDAASKTCYAEYAKTDQFYSGLSIDAQKVSEQFGIGPKCCPFPKGVTTTMIDYVFVDDVYENKTIAEFVGSDVKDGDDAEFKENPPIGCNVNGQKCSRRAEFNSLLWDFLPSFRPIDAKCVDDNDREIPCSPSKKK